MAQQCPSVLEIYEEHGNVMPRDADIGGTPGILVWRWFAPEDKIVKITFYGNQPENYFTSLPNNPPCKYQVVYTQPAPVNEPFQYCIQRVGDPECPSTLEGADEGLGLPIIRNGGG